MDAEELLSRARALLRVPSSPGHHRRVLGIVGAPGAGKSTLTRWLLARLTAEEGADAVAHLPMDGFHLADVQLDRLGLRDRKGAPETFDVDGYLASLRRVRAGGPRPVYAPGFERELEQPIAAALVIEPSARLVVTEGNYLLLRAGAWREVAGLLDETWSVTVDPAVRRDRLIARHVRFGKSPADAVAWVDRSDEANARLVAATLTAADIVLDVDGLRLA